MFIRKARESREMLPSMIDTVRHIAVVAER